MKRVVLIFGVILGMVLSIFGLYMVHLIYSGYNFKGNAFLGYATQVVMLSIIFFGIRNYRNKYLGGIISFWKAIKTGTLILLLAATMYVVLWLFYYYLFVPDFIDKYTAHVLANTPAADQADKTTEMEQFGEMYKNPVFVILITYAEVLPVGLLVTLVSALILKKKKAAQA